MNDNNDDEREIFLNNKNENKLSKVNSASLNFNYLFENEEEDKKDDIPNIKKSKEIICPKCEENCNIDIFDYQILLYGCKNNHKTNNVFFKEFELTQMHDKSKIICDNCKESKKNKILDDDFYTCQKCNINLCSLCKLSHDETHDIIDYEQKNYICSEHNQSYNSFCQTCKKDICKSCEENHYNHKVIQFIDIMPNINNIKMKRNELKNSISKIKDGINEVMKMLENVSKSFDLYYQIYNNILFSFDTNNLNYNLLYNINKISKKSDIIETANKISNEILLINKINIIYDIFKKFNIKENNEITINYSIKDKKENEIRIFNSLFVQNNKNNCKIIYDDNEYELQEIFNVENIKNENDILTISLRGIRNITSMDNIFNDCSTLISVPDISKWNTSNIESMENIFCGCKLLKSLPDISKWDTSNVKRMNSMFKGCSSLEYLPDISNWDTSNVIDMSCMFYECSSLKSIPDISKWNTSKLDSKGMMFNGCKSSLKIPTKFKESIFKSFLGH